MKTKEFTAFHLTPDHSMKLLNDRINTFLKEDKSIVVISLSHSVIATGSILELEKFMASALLCYK